MSTGMSVTTRDLPNYDSIVQYFHLPLADAAEKLEICPSLLKKLCRNHGIKRWPYRKLKSIDKALLKFEDQLRNVSDANERDIIMREIEAHRLQRKTLLENPTLLEPPPKLPKLPKQSKLDSVPPTQNKHNNNNMHEQTQRVINNTGSGISISNSSSNHNRAILEECCKIVSENYSKGFTFGYPSLNVSEILSSNVNNSADESSSNLDRHHFHDHSHHIQQRRNLKPDILRTSLDLKDTSTTSSSNDVNREKKRRSWSPEFQFSFQSTSSQTNHFTSNHNGGKHYHTCYRVPTLPYPHIRGNNNYESIAEKESRRSHGDTEFSKSTIADFNEIRNLVNEICGKKRSNGNNGGETGKQGPLSSEDNDNDNQMLPSFSSFVKKLNDM